MTTSGSEHGLGDEDVEAVLAMQGVDSDRPRTGALILALDDPLRIAWANAAATHLFETDNPDELFTQVFAGRGREGLGASVSRLVVDGAPRLERLRLIRGFQSRTLAVIASRSRLPDGRDVVMLTTPSQDGPGDPAQFMQSGLNRPAPPPSDFVEDLPAPLPNAERPTAAGPVEEAAAPAEEETAIPAPALATEEAHDPVAEVRERLAGRRPTRLIWQTDAAHRLVKLTGGVAELLGIDDPSRLGERIDNLVLDDDAENGLHAALASSGSWSALRTRWPLASAAATVGVVLGAVPVSDGAGGFSGFRGFGVVDLADLQPLRAETGGEAQPQSAVDSVDAAAVEGGSPSPPSGATAAAGPPATADVAVDTPPPDPDVRERVADAGLPATDPVAPDRPFGFSSKVVALRPYQTFSASTVPSPGAEHEEAGAAAPIADEPAAADASEPADREPAAAVDLTSIEQSNFHEIGRALLGVETDETVSPSGPAQVPLAETNAAGALQALGLAVLVVGPDRFLYANPSFFALTGYPTLDSLAAAGGLSHLLGGLEPHVVLGSAEDRAFPLVAGGGAIIGMQGRVQAMTWDGSPANLVTMRPATDRIAQVQMLEGEIKRRDVELSELRMMLDRMSDSLVTVDRQARVLTLNGAAEWLFGYAVAQVAGEPIAMLVGPDAQIAVSAGESAAGLGQAGLDVAGRTATGKALSLRMTWQSLSHGRSFVVLRDLQERSSLQRELASAQERLAQALAGKPEFLAKVSHEIRTPLNAILGFAEVILDERFGPIGNERYKSYLQDIHESGTEVLGLVNDLLDLSKMEAGRMELHPQPLDVNRIIGECVGEMQTMAHRERVIVRLSLLPHLSAALIDEHAFRQIMGHILSNAIRFNEPGGQVIVSTAMNDAGAVAVRVRDTGIGMTEAEIAAAMEPFRLSRTATSGTGLGLPLARALIEANGATMSIRSKKNEGTLVEILLPSCPAEAIRVPAE